MDFVGIDVGKKQLHLVLLQGDKVAKKTVPNSAAGFEQLKHWLINRKVAEAHVCLEATGSYGIGVAEYLYDLGYQVSVVNPAQVKAFGRSELVRTKTDDIDAGIIARFCRANKPFPWNPPPQHVRELRALVRRRETVTSMITAEKNRFEASTTGEVRRSIKAVLAGLERELKVLDSEIGDHIDRHPDLRVQIDRLDEIPGFGALTAIKVIVETGDFIVCNTTREIVAFAGLNPRLYQSGTIRRHAGISKIGNAALRKALFFAALSAKRHSAYFRPFVKRLEAAGKRPMVIITALMRKLLVLAFTLAKAQSRFDPSFAP